MLQSGSGTTVGRNYNNNNNNNNNSSSNAFDNNNHNNNHSNNRNNNNSSISTPMNSPSRMKLRPISITIFILFLVTQRSGGTSFDFDAASSDSKDVTSRDPDDRDIPVFADDAVEDEDDDAEDDPGWSVSGQNRFNRSNRLSGFRGDLGKRSLADDQLKLWTLKNLLVNENDQKVASERSKKAYLQRKNRIHSKFRGDLGKRSFFGRENHF